MKFQVSRQSQGAVSKNPPCAGAERGPESPAWPGEYEWLIEVDSLDALMAFVEKHDGAIGLFTPEEDETHPTLEIFDDEEE